MISYRGTLSYIYMHSIAFMNIAFHSALNAFCSWCILVHSRIHTAFQRIHHVIAFTHRCILGLLHSLALMCMHTSSLHSYAFMCQTAFRCIRTHSDLLHSNTFTCIHMPTPKCVRMCLNAFKCACMLRNAPSLHPSLLLRRRCCRAQGRCRAGCA